MVAFLTSIGNFHFIVWVFLEHKKVNLTIQNYSIDHSKSKSQFQSESELLRSELLINQQRSVYTIGLLDQAHSNIKQLTIQIIFKTPLRHFETKVMSKINV